MDEAQESGPILVMGSTIYGLAEHGGNGWSAHVQGHPKSDEIAASIVKCCNGYPKLASLLRRWSALDAGAWHHDRHAAEKKELLADTRAVLTDLQEDDNGRK